MDSEQAETKTCPSCGGKLQGIIYGRVTQEALENPELIIGNCIIDGKEPQLGCIECGWRGFPGGREFRTKFNKNVAEPTHSEMVEGVLQLDLVEVSNTDLMALAATLLEARLELIHRGVVSREDIDRLSFENEHWRSLPLDSKEEIVAYFDAETQRVIAVAQFLASKNCHLFMYVRPGMKEWGTLLTREEFRDFVESLKRPRLQSWELTVGEDETPEEFIQGRSSYANDVIKTVWANEKVTFKQLRTNGLRYEQPILWPWWFDEVQAFR